MSERRRVTELAGRNPSIGLTPLPTGTGSTLQPFPQIRGGHRINVDADILGEKTREGNALGEGRLSFISLIVIDLLLCEASKSAAFHRFCALRDLATIKPQWRD